LLIDGTRFRVAVILAFKVSAGGQEIGGERLKGMAGEDFP
jgi:hypothetical protein